MEKFAKIKASPKKPKKIKATDPTFAKFKFLVAEDARHELGGKITVIGLFPDDTVVVAIPEERINESLADPEIGFQLPRLIFIVSVSNIVGEYAVKVQVMDPNGEPHSPPFSVESFTIEKGASQTLRVGDGPFPFRLSGIYNFQLTLNDTVFNFPFEIRITKA